MSSRCNVCKKRVGIDYFECKCDLSAKFCKNHKYPFEHDCKLDQHKKQQTILKDKMIKVSHDKLVERI
jgi:hypothetical protein